MRRRRATSGWLRTRGVSVGWLVLAAQQSRSVASLSKSAKDCSWSLHWKQSPQEAVHIAWSVALAPASGIASRTRIGMAAEKQVPGLGRRTGEPAELQARYQQAELQPGLREVRGAVSRCKSRAQDRPTHRHSSATGARTGNSNGSRKTRV